jgi:hypothetical protein
LAIEARTCQRLPCLTQEAARLTAARAALSGAAALEVAQHQPPGDGHR